MVSSDSSTFSSAKLVAILAVGLLSFGFAPILVRLAPGTSPLVLAAFRTGFAVLFLAPFWIRRDRSNPGILQQWSGKTKAALAGIALGLHFACWIASLSYTSVASASVLVTIHPIMLIVVERFFLKRHFSGIVWIGVLLAFGGSTLLSVADQQLAHSQFANPLFGNALAFTAAAIFVIYILLGQQVRQESEWIDYVFQVYSYAAATCLLLAVILGVPLLEIDSRGLWVGAGLAFGPQILGHGSMNYAVKYVSPTLLSTTILAEPLIATVLAWMLFEEVPPVTSILAMVIIMVGISLTWKRRFRSAKDATDQGEA
jgi:drug/metabolite transporter (DMT)-like permease